MLSFQEAMSMLDDMSSSVNSPAMEDIYREMSPILTELLKLKPGNNNHPTVKNLFNWLVDPKRTGEEFSYVVGPLQHHLAEVLDEIDEDYGNCYDDGSYIGKMGLEAMSIICPILDGHWEKAAFFLAQENCCYSQKKQGAVSDRLSSWIIQVIGNSDICPNLNLRIKLMSLLPLMVDHSQAQSLQSVLAALSSLNTKIHEIELDIIKDAL